MRRAPEAFEGFCQGISQPLGASGLAVLLTPGLAFASALPPSVILTPPTGHYITAAALTVALTALLGAAAHRLPVMAPRLIWERPAVLPVALTSYLSFLAFLALVFVGLFGERDPMHNLMTLVFWTGVWIVVPLASMLLGNHWRPINPWTGPVRIARTLLGRGGSIGLSRLGHWPAVLGYAGFVWFQMVSLYPDDPAVLAKIALGYWLVVFVLAVLEGDDWLARGEFLTVLFGFIAKVAPLWQETSGNRVRLRDRASDACIPGHRGGLSCGALSGDAAHRRAVHAGCTERSLPHRRQLAGSAAVLRLVRVPDRSAGDAAGLCRPVRRHPVRASAGGDPGSQACRAGCTAYGAPAIDRGDGCLHGAGSLASVHGQDRMIGLDNFRAFAPQ